MTTPRKQAELSLIAKAKLVTLLTLVNDAILRVNDNLNDSELNAPACIYIDRQLAKAITWLASARSVAITQGQLVEPHFDELDVWDLADEIALAPDAESKRNGGAS